MGMIEDTWNNPSPPLHIYIFLVLLKISRATRTMVLWSLYLVESAESVRSSRERKTIRLRTCSELRRGHFTASDVRMLAACYLLDVSEMMYTRISNMVGCSLMCSVWYDVTDTHKK